MNLLRSFSLFVSALCLASPILADAPVAGPVRYVVAAGGGNVGDDIRLHLVSLSQADEPRVLIIPHAARPENFERSGTRNAEVFRNLGFKHVDVLDLTDPEGAREAIEDCDVIWMPGGLQRLLMQALDEAGLADAVRARVAAGVPVGGTSAGAAIMSETMIASSRRDDETGALIPIMSHGLGFWPDVIVDQHFSERSRLPRLKEAVRQHPKLLGIGIDEDTAVIHNGSYYEVMGPNTVTFLRFLAVEEGEPRFEKTILRHGERFPKNLCKAEATCGNAMAN